MSAGCLDGKDRGERVAGEGEGEGDVDGCVTTRAFFDEQAWPQVFGTVCIGCHVVGGQAERTRMVLDELDPEHNRRAIGSLARAEVDGSPLFLVKPFGGADHGGGVVLQEAGLERAILEELVARARQSVACDDVAFGTAVCEAFEPERQKLRFLTRAELDASIRAAFGVTTTTFVAQLPDETDVNGFDSAARFLLADDGRIDGILGAIGDLAPALNASLACVTRNKACVAGFLDDTLPLLWRRPVTADEKNELLALFDSGTADGGSFADGFEGVLLGAASAPEFVYRRELGENGVLSAREQGELLAYALTGAPPDAALRAAVDDDSIVVANVREQHARRLLQTPAAQEHLVDFVVQWLSLQKLETTAKSTSAYPQWNEALRSTLQREARTYVKSALFEDDGSLQALLAGPFGFVDAATVGLYGVSLPEVAAGAVVDVVSAVDLVGLNSGTGQYFASEDAFMLFSNGAVRGTVDVPSTGSWGVSVNTFGEVVDGVGCAFEVLVDGLRVGNRVTSAAIDAPLVSTFSVTLDAGPHDVEVRFTNDFFDGAGRDRNLRIVEVSLREAALGVVERDGLLRVDLPDRPGLLLKAGVLAAFANPLGSSPVKRGKLIRNRLFCMDIPPPPPDVSTEPPGADALNEIHTTRDRYNVHSTNPRCAACHDQIDPLGFGFEGFDGVGVARSEENGYPIDATGAVRGTVATDAEFDDAVGLIELLKDSADVRRCLAQSYAMHVFGSARAYSDGCVDPAIVDLVQDSGSIVDLAARLPTTEAFFRRSAP